MKAPRGFTLVELLVVIAIVGILATIAFPTYQNSVAKSRRASAKTLMTQVAQAEERFYTQNNAYTSTLTNLGFSSDPTRTDGNSHSVSVVATTTTYTISAVPLITDTACGTLTLSNVNVRGASGTQAGTCW